MSELVNMHAAKSNLSKLVEMVLAGETVTIARNGEPLVDLVIHKKPKRELGFGKELIWVAPGYDIDAIDPDIDWNLDEKYE
jgi:antitoxin (DNA-binding transcriptional repressor) of toxin-antitoxin stability system